jgi:RNA polymerase sigma-70 factor (ECF subfamily)
MAMGPDDAELYRKHAHELVRFATVVAGPSAAEDVVATAVLRVFSSPGWPDVVAKRAYLFRAVLNEAQQNHRSYERRRRREARVAGNERPLEGADGHGTVRPAVHAAMGRLSPRQRAVVYLTYWLDLAADDVAGRLAVSPRTVARELATARRRMEVLLR